MQKELIVYNVSELPAEMKSAAITNKTARIAELKAAFEEAIDSDVFMSFEDKIDSLLDALSIPISNDQSYNQFFIHSQKDLHGEAALAAFKNQTVPVLPTLDKIHTEARKRYDIKAAKLQQQSEKKAAKVPKPSAQPEQAAA